MTDRNFGNMAIPEARADAPASIVVYPAPQPESSMGKLGAFALGVVTGVVGVAVTAAIMEELESDDFSPTPQHHKTDALINMTE